MSTSGITCSACLTGTIKPDIPTGTVEKVFGRDTYVARPYTSKSSSEPATATASGADTGLDNRDGLEEDKKAKGIIVLLPDLFGWAVSNCRLLADSYAKEGFLVLLPDFMDGTAPPPWTMQTMDSLLSPSPSIFTTLFKKPLWALQIASQAIPFLIRNKESVVVPRMMAFHRAIRETPTSEMKSLRVGSAGFCWGGKYTILLAQGEKYELGAGQGRESARGLIDAAFVAHPSKMAFPSDWERISVPFSMAIGDVDMGIGIEHVRKIERVLEGKKMSGDSGHGSEIMRDTASEVVVYKGAKHGFAIRGDWTDEGQRKSAEEAKEQALSWFARWLA